MKYITVFFIYFTLLLSAPAVYAYDMDGKMFDNGDGTFDVYLKNGYGREFSGVAQNEGDGEFAVSVEDDLGQSYDGVALSNHEGGYMLNLENDDNGMMATGELFVQE